MIKGTVQLDFLFCCEFETFFFFFLSFFSRFISWQLLLFFLFFCLVAHHCRFTLVSERILQVFGLAQSETYVNFLLSKVAITLANNSTDDEDLVNAIRTSV
jgi:hypothetical protein